MTPWKIPVVVSGLAVPIVAGFLLVGPAAGVALGAVAAVAVVAVAVRARPRGPIGETAVGSGRRMLVVIVGGVDADRLAEEIGVRLGSADDSQVMVLAPVHIGFLDRWASDVEGSREEAQRSLVSVVASLAKAGISAEGRVGDESVVQAVEDQIGTFPATDVLLVTGEGEERDAAAELRERLLPRFEHLVGPTRFTVSP